MNKIMGGMSVKSKVVSGHAAASEARASGAQASDIFRDILAASSSPSAPDVAELARVWKCNVEQARCSLLMFVSVGAQPAHSDSGAQHRGSHRRLHW
jgi:hypothetical protein